MPTAAPLAISPGAGTAAGQSVPVPAAASRLGSSALNAASLRASWQAMLASLSAGSDALVGYEADSSEDRATVAPAVAQESLGDAQTSAAPSLALPKEFESEATSQQAVGAGDHCAPRFAKSLTPTGCTSSSSSLPETGGAHAWGTMKSSKPDPGSRNKMPGAKNVVAAQPLQMIVSPQIMAPAGSVVPPQLEQTAKPMRPTPAGPLPSSQIEATLTGQPGLAAAPSVNETNGAGKETAPAVPEASDDGSGTMARDHIGPAMHLSGFAADALHAQSEAVAPGGELGPWQPASGTEATTGIVRDEASGKADVAAASISAADLVNTAKSSASGERRADRAVRAEKMEASVPAAQSMAAGADVSGAARFFSTGHAPFNVVPVNSSGNSSESAGGLETGSSAREPFAALDAGPGQGTSGWIHAGAHSAEAGFDDPALGWVGVRADLTPGGVQAAVVPGSAEAAQSLGSHMAGLHTYLNEQRTPVETLTLAAPGSRGGDASLPQSMQQGGDQSAGRGGSSGSHSNWQRGSVAGLNSVAADGALPMASLGRSAGTYISVVA